MNNWNFDTKQQFKNQRLALMILYSIILILPMFLSIMVKSFIPLIIPACGTFGLVRATYTFLKYFSISPFSFFIKVD